jgi:hypothetical protein
MDVFGDHLTKSLAPRTAFGASSIGTFKPNGSHVGVADRS